MFEVAILIVKPELAQSEFDTLLPLVAPEKCERIKRYHFFRDARNTLLGDVLARAEICRITGFGNSQLAFSTNEHGKPYLVGNNRIYHNISHSGNFIACAVADVPVGIDIELVKPIDMKIADRFFAPDENAFINFDQQMHRFFIVWTKKESRIKWEGKGLSIPLNSFSVLDPSQRDDVYYHEVFHSDEAICHVCSTHREKPSVQVIFTPTLLSRLNVAEPWPEQKNSEN